MEDRTPTETATSVTFMLAVMLGIGYLLFVWFFLSVGIGMGNASQCMGIDPACGSRAGEAIVVGGVIALGGFVGSLWLAVRTRDPGVAWLNLQTTTVGAVAAVGINGASIPG